jgi:hypothetical protein
MHNITRNLEAEFNEAELMPKTKKAAIMAAAAYISANASNGDEHMRHLRNPTYPMSHHAFIPKTDI